MINNPGNTGGTVTPIELPAPPGAKDLSTEKKPVIDGVTMKRFMEKPYTDQNLQTENTIDLRITEENGGLKISKKRVPDAMIDAMISPLKNPIPLDQIPSLFSQYETDATKRVGKRVMTISGNQYELYIHCNKQNKTMSFSYKKL